FLLDRKPTLYRQVSVGSSQSKIEHYQTEIQSLKLALPPANDSSNQQVKAEVVMSNE
ncbi:MAG: LapA family protein, partial [Hapalosiphonaceae cyanobacterium JJU2]